jgi:hypothetical protein
MMRVLSLPIILLFAGCADPSKGSALNECRLHYYLDSADLQRRLITDCMRARSFEAAACDPAADEREWDLQVRAFAFDNPRCYRPVTFTTRITTFLSPM